MLLNLRCPGGCPGAVEKLVDHGAPMPACASCGKPMERDAEPPTTSTYERIDNGLMPRAVERFADAERLSHERAKAPRR